MQEPVDGQLYFGDPSNNSAPSALFPNEPTSSRNPRRSLIQGSSYTAPPGNNPATINNSSYVPMGAMPNNVAPVGYRPLATPSTPVPTTSGTTTTIRR
jgi:hypothetical protein